MAENYAIPFGCIVNVISFEDCAIGYDIIDQLVSKTGGLPYNISFSDINKEKVATNETIDFLKLEMVDAFCDSTKQFCYGTKISIQTSNTKIKIHSPSEYKKMMKVE